MQWPEISAQDGLKLLKAGARALDVRSEGEFQRGNIPGFANIPILKNEHRHEVGLTYKEMGQAAAIELGLKLVTPLRKNLLNGWQEVLHPALEEQRLLICWRGGLRSKMTAEWLAETGFTGRRVTGGYKAMRGKLLHALTHPPEFLVVGGLTGAGKTELLNSLPVPSVLDLEFLANHRGSSFGLRMKEDQPHQQTFENAVGLSLFDGPSNMAVEAESRLVGRCVVPDAVKAAMDRSPLIILESSQEERVRRIFAEYVRTPLNQFSKDEVHEHLGAALKRVQKRLGGLRYQEINGLLDGAFAQSELNLESHTAWIESLLREYYDPQYEFALNAKNRPVQFRGDAASVKAFLADRLDRRRS